MNIFEAKSLKKVVALAYRQITKNIIFTNNFVMKCELEMLGMIPSVHVEENSNIYKYGSFYQFITSSLFLIEKLYMILSKLFGYNES